jgi:glycosyltransferase involved in cell wall biosynthesis
MTLQRSLSEAERLISAALPRRVCFLINSMEGGGAERAMANLISLVLPSLGAERVELLLLDDFPCEQTLPQGLRVTKLTGNGKTLRSLRELNKHWSKSTNRPDVCVSFLARANILNVVLARRFGHKAIISERVNTSSHIAASRAEPILARVIRAVYPRADRVVAVSEGVKEDLVTRFGVSRQSIVVIGNPVNADQLSTLAKEEPAVLLGQGSELDSLRDQARQLGILDRVIFAGFVRNPYPVVARARALVAASRAEGFPNTLIEAISLGCPVIATDCPSGPADVLGGRPARMDPWPDDAHGLLIPMEDRDAMANAISKLGDDAVRNNYAAKATSRAKKYGVTAAKSAYLDLLANVAE